MQQILGYETAVVRNIQLRIVLYSLSNDFLEKIRKLYKDLQAQLSQLDLGQLSLYVISQLALNFSPFIMYYTPQDQVHI